MTKVGAWISWGLDWDWQVCQAERLRRFSIVILGQAFALACPVLAKRSRPYALAGQGKGALSQPGSRCAWNLVLLRERAGGRGLSAGKPPEPFLAPKPSKS